MLLVRGNCACRLELAQRTQSNTTMFLNLEKTFVFIVDLV